jgi:hypothetical protein
MGARWSVERQESADVAAFLHPLTQGYELVGVRGVKGWLLVHGHCSPMYRSKALIAGSIE